MQGEPAMRDRKATQSPASIFVVFSLANRGLFERIKFAMEFGDHQLKPLARGIDHRGGNAFCAGNLGEEHFDVRHGFHKCGALAPRNRSTNQNAQIARNERKKISPHARKVDTKLVAMTSSQLS